MIKCSQVKFLDKLNHTIQKCPHCNAPLSMFKLFRMIVWRCGPYFCPECGCRSNLDPRDRWLFCAIGGLLGLFIGGNLRHGLFSPIFRCLGLWALLPIVLFLFFLLTIAQIFFCRFKPEPKNTKRPS